MTSITTNYIEQFNKFKEEQKHVQIMIDFLVEETKDHVKSLDEAKEEIKKEGKNKYNEEDLRLYKELASNDHQLKTMYNYKYWFFQHEINVLEAEIFELASKELVKYLEEKEGKRK